MVNVSYSQYIKDLDEFIARHSKMYNWVVETSHMDESSLYTKNYMFEDGATFYEVNDMNHWETVEAGAHGLIFTVPVKFIKHEYWSTDDSTSKYWYEVVREIG